MTHQAQLDLYELHTGRRGAAGGGGGRGGRGAVARGGRPRGAGGGLGGTAAAAAAAASQELSTSGKTPGASRPGTKYPVQGNPSLRHTPICFFVGHVKLT